MISELRSQKAFVILDLFQNLIVSINQQHYISRNKFGMTVMAPPVI